MHSDPNYSPQELFTDPNTQGKVPRSYGRRNKNRGYVKVQATTRTVATATEHVVTAEVVDSVDSDITVVVPDSEELDTPQDEATQSEETES